MNKVVTINLGGMAYQLEEGGYDALRAYLETAAARLQGNPDRDEIISDIERAIADKFRALLASHKTVVEVKEVATVLTEMGPIEGDPGETASAGTGADSKSASAPGNIGASGTTGDPRAGTTGARPRRLYAIYDGAVLCGVCNGIGAYFGIDPTFVRLAFAFSVLFFGSGIVVYIILAILIPEARTPEEKASATGTPFTAQEYIRRAKEGYYKTVKNFPDRRAWREWNRNFRREMRGWRRSFRYGRMPPMPPMSPMPPWPGGTGFALPWLTMLQGLFTLLWVCALVSLLSTGAVLGMDLPGNVPVWVAAMLLCMAFGIICWPLKVARRGYYYWGHGGARWGRPFVFFLDAGVWLLLVVALVWMAAHFFPEVREAIHNFPSIVHQATTDIKDWWKN